MRALRLDGLCSGGDYELWYNANVLKTLAPPAAPGRGRNPDRTPMTELPADASSDSEDLRLAQQEIRHLKGTIAALRDELEGARYQKDQAVQEAVAASNNEIVQLRQTVAALRDELERVRYDKEKAVQEAVAAANSEIVQLRQTAQALRDELERLRFDKDEAVQAVTRNSADEIAQLKGAAQVLRDRMDALRIEYENKIQEIKRQSRDEVAQLHDTIRTLRDRFENEVRPLAERAAALGLARPAVAATENVVKPMGTRTGVPAKDV